MGGFSAILENPPYVRAERMERVHRDYFMSVYNAKGRFDLYSVFCELSLEICNQQGYVSHVTPSAICSKSNAKGAREKILSMSNIVCIFDGSGKKIFKGASVDTVAITVKKTSSNGTFIVLNNDFSKRGVVAQTSCELLGGVFPLNFDEKVMLKWTQIMSVHPQVGDFYSVMNGLVGHHPETGEGVARLVSSSSEIAEARPYVEAKELSHMDLSPKNSRFISYLPEEMHRPRKPELFESCKIMIPAIQDREFLISYHDSSNLYCNHTMILINSLEKDGNLIGLFCWLRTKHVIEFLKNIRLVGNGINPADIRAIPYPENILNNCGIDFETVELTLENITKLTIQIEAELERTVVS